MFDAGLRALLSPLLVYQALSVRRIAQSLPEPSGPRAGTIGQGPPLRLAIIGDSSAAGVGSATQATALSGQLTGLLAQSFRLTWHLDALTGATTRSTLDRLATARAKPLDAIVLVLGTNDVTRLVPRRLWLRQQQALLDRLTRLYQPRRFYITAVPPLEHFPLLPQPLRWSLGRHAKRLETARQQALANRTDCTLLPFTFDPDPAFVASDGFHPSEKLNSLWAKEMASRITSDWPI